MFVINHIKKLLKKKPILETMSKNVYHAVNRGLHPNTLPEMPLQPVERKLGFSRGKSIDRYYIEKFLNENRNLISGNIMEIAENTYTKKYGHNIKNSFMFSYENNNNSDMIIGDLSTGAGCNDNLLNCFILTQTLPFIFNIHSAAENIVKMLMPGGVALVTVSGLSQISQYDYDRWGHYWGFTELSLKKLFEEFVPSENIIVGSYGNAKIASAFIYGLALEDISTKDLEYKDSLFPILITAIIKK